MRILNIDIPDVPAQPKSNAPVVLRGLVRDWPLVSAALDARDTLHAYLLAFDSGEPFEAMIAGPDAQGRLFYNATMTGFNFERMNGTFKEGLKILERFEHEARPPTFYFGAKAVSHYLPGLEAELSMPLAEEAQCNIWIGNQLSIAAHTDNADNLACVAAGRRRFLLFPPEVEEALYIGPDTPTPSGRPISLVNPADPDLRAFPLYTVALKQAQSVELFPGDVLYIPKGWWHHVDSLDSMNILVNFWWEGPPAWPATLP